MRARLLIVGLLLLPSILHAQTQTAVSATITDPNGIPYANGTFSIQLVPGGTNPSVNGAAIQGAFNGSTSATGSFSISLWPNASITPGSTQWSFTICSNSGGIQPPLGTGTQCTPPTAITISGTAQVLTTTLSNVAPKLTNFLTGGTGSVTSVAATSPIVVTPSPITGAGTVSCPTCSTSSSTVPINQVTSATGPITPIAIGTNALVINCSVTAATSCDTFGETSASTGSGFVLVASTLNGSAAQAFTVAPGTAGPAGANAPNSMGVNGQTGGPAGSSQNGFTGSGIFMVVGNGSAGGATTGNGGSGGSWTLGGGSGGAAGGSSANNGGAGGAINWGLGNGAAGAATGNGGAGGTFNINPGSPTSGAGGAGGAISGTGGAGADLNFTSGIGGSAAVGSTSGRGGNVTFSMGGAGVTGTAGVPGEFLISRGTGPTGSTTTPLLAVIDTWNTSGVVDALIFANVTVDTASGAGSLLMDLQDAGVPKFKVDKTGIATVNKLTIPGSSSGSASISVPAAAGTPCTILLPTTNPTIGQVLSSAAPSGGNCQTSWAASGGTIAIPATVSGATSGGIPCFDSTTDMNTTALIAVNDPVAGGGAGACVKDSGIPYSFGARTAATSNLAIGSSALTANGAGTDTNEVAIGASALAAETGAAGGGNTTAVGWHALLLQVGSSGNNAGFGELALGSLTTGNNDTGVGRGACFNLTTTNNNTCVGSTNNLGAATDSNETVIGATATGAGSNTATIGNASVTDAHFGGASDNAIVHGKGFNTASNCSSSAAPAVCGSAAAGSVVIAAAGTTVTVNTTAVTANSQIFLLADDTLGTKLSVTCNSTLATLIGGLAVTARTAATSFQITSGATPAVNPLCISYLIIN